ncbi:hypothetical protein C8R46DRAFT_1203081 [Mycena filopes]|nr:hypothetical protein C8R46DRAFT_1203081 [Mycena filopes]
MPSCLPPPPSTTTLLAHLLFPPAPVPPRHTRRSKIGSHVDRAPGPAFSASLEEFQVDSPGTTYRLFLARILDGGSWTTQRGWHACSTLPGASSRLLRLRARALRRAASRISASPHGVEHFCSDCASEPYPPPSHSPISPLTATLSAVAALSACRRDNHSRPPSRHHGEAARPRLHLALERAAPARGWTIRCAALRRRAAGGAQQGAQ